MKIVTNRGSLRLQNKLQVLDENWNWRKEKTKFGRGNEALKEENVTGDASAMHACFSRCRHTAA